MTTCVLFKSTNFRYISAMQRSVGHSEEKKDSKTTKATRSKVPCQKTETTKPN